MRGHIFLLLSLLFQSLPASYQVSAQPTSASLEISTTEELEEALASAYPGLEVLLLADTLELEHTLLVKTPNVQIVSKSGTRIRCVEPTAAFKITEGDTLLKGIVFENCPQAVQVQVAEDALPTLLEDVKFANNRATEMFSAGGALYLEATTARSKNVDEAVEGTPQVIIQSCSFENNAADTGGAIFAENVNLTVLNSVFEHNEGSSRGGAIAVEGRRSECRILHSTFYQNQVTGIGFNVELTQVKGFPIEPFRYYKFPFPTATGGAILSSTISKLQIFDCNFTKNEATAGGAISTEVEFDRDLSKKKIASRMIVQKSTFVENRATNFSDDESSENKLGGAIYTVSALSGLEWKVRDCHFRHNSARDGGAVHLVAASTAISSIRDSVFEDNEATRFGGAVLLRNSGSMNIKACQFRGNEAVKAGGGVMTTNNAMLLVDGLAGLPPDTRIGSSNNFTANEAARGGGIACIACGSLLVRDARIEKNIASVAGGGVYLFDSDASIELQQTHIVGNKAETGGGVSAEAVARVTFSSAEESLKTFLANNAAATGSAVFYRASHQKENRFRMANAEVTEHTSSPGNTKTKNGGTLQLELDNLPDKAVADIVLYGVVLEKNDAVFGGGLSIDIKGSWNREPRLLCPDADLSHNPCRMLRLVSVRITDNTAEKAPGLHITDSNAVSLMCSLSINKPRKTLFDVLTASESESETQAVDALCAKFTNNFIKVHTPGSSPFSHTSAWI